VANQSAVQQNGEAVVRDEPVPHSLAPSGAFFLIELFTKAYKALLRGFLRFTAYYFLLSKTTYNSAFICSWF